jgi:hypothetical protein
MTQTGGLVILYAWLIFAGLLTVLGYLLLRHEQDPLQDLTRPGQDDHDQAKSLQADDSAGLSSRDRTRPPGQGPPAPAAGQMICGYPCRQHSHGLRLSQGNPSSTSLVRMVPGRPGRAW